jgi:hypothetical protein
MKNRRTLLKTIGINGLVLFGIIAFLEIGSSLILECHQKDPVQTNESTDLKRLLPNYRDWPWAAQYWKEHHKRAAQYSSYVAWNMIPQKGECINIDSLGRRRSFPFDHSRKEMPLMVFLGGSTMWGTGAIDGLTIPSMYAKKITNENVQNWGQSGFSSFQSYIWLQIEIMKGLRPKRVVSYDGVNDSPAKRLFFKHNRERMFRELIKGADKADRQSYFLCSSLTLLKHVKKKLFPESQANKAQLYPSSSRRNKEAAIELLESWLGMKRLCDEVDAEFICILQPNAFVGAPNIDNLLASEMTNWHGGRQNGYKYYREVIELLQSPKYKALTPCFIDMTNVFDGVENVYVDFCHVSPNGNELIVEYLLRKDGTK